jgi:predicted DsbA family dithiol-disulfide isomerase
MAASPPRHRQSYRLKKDEAHQPEGPSSGRGRTMEDMSEPQPVCDDQGCTATPGEFHDSGEATARPGSTLLIDVVSDVICPWCFIGKRRLEKALALLGNPAGVKVAWRPFQLNPRMPPGGMERQAYRTAKFGNWERSLALDTQVAEAGRGEGIAFAFDRMLRTPNTLDAHRLLWLAGRLGVQDGVAESLYRGYFTEGADLNDRPTLVTLATGGGIPAAEAERLLAGGEGRAEVLAEEGKYKTSGISGVPAFFFGGEFAFSGAVGPRLLAEAIRRAREGA